MFGSIYFTSLQEIVEGENLSFTITESPVEIKTFVLEI